MDLRIAGFIESKNLLKSFFWRKCCVFVCGGLNVPYSLVQV
jgi:hypothetical protein